MRQTLIRQIAACIIVAVLALPMHKSHAQNGDTLIVIAAGDIMPGTSFPSDMYLPPDSGFAIFDPVKDWLQNGDVVFGNLEGCLLNHGGVAKRCQDSTKCYAFRIPEYFGGILKSAGFNLLNLANNHSGDFGFAGRQSTQKVLNSCGIWFAGLNSCPSVIFETAGLKIGFCGVSPFNGTVDILKYDTIRKMISRLDSLCNVVIVSMHAGAEGAVYNRVTRETEYFFDENRGNVFEFAHMAVDAGADLILGHGPHVTRAAELYKGRFIAYSLGNFCTYARFNLNGPNGVAPLLRICLSPEGEFLGGQIYPIKQTGEGGPKKDAARLSIRQLKILIADDFPETGLLIDDHGKISVK